MSYQTAEKSYEERFLEACALLQKEIEQTKDPEQKKEMEQRLQKAKENHDRIRSNKIKYGLNEPQSSQYITM